MRNYLHGFPLVITPPFLADHSLIYLPGGYVVGLRSGNVQESLVMAEVQVGFSSIFGYITLSVLIRIQGTGVYIYVRIQFLNGDGIPPRLKQLGQRRGYDPFPERRGNSPGNEDISRFNHSRTSL
jgi:hypothetical protein